MAGSKHFKALRKEMEALGYEFDHVNAKSLWVFSCAGRADVAVSTGIPDHFARVVLKSLKRLHGVGEDVHKRNAVRSKSRQAATRERARAETVRRRDEIARLLSRRDELLGGAGAVLTDCEVASISRQIEAEERELLRWQKLMQEIPDVNAHSGRLVAQHRS